MIGGGWLVLPATSFELRYEFWDIASVEKQALEQCNTSHLAPADRDSESWLFRG